MSREEPAERLERDADRLEEQGDRVEQHIDETRSDWESKEQDASVPGAQPREESDQLPEEGPSEQVPEDEAATGNPDAAGAEDPDD
jgi:hypothetical protein